MQASRLLHRFRHLSDNLFGLPHCFASYMVEKQIQIGVSPASSTAFSERSTIESNSPSPACAVVIASFEYRCMLGISLIQKATVDRLISTSARCSIFSGRSCVSAASRSGRAFIHMPTLTNAYSFCRSCCILSAHKPRDHKTRGKILEEDFHR